MSISFPTGDSKSTLETIREQRAGTTRATTPRATSSARIEANRRNSRKSTGPRTIEGKRRASRNAMKHGLCRTLSCLPSECEATFLTFVAELETELRPATAMQRLAFNQIASLIWRLERLPEAQTKLFAEELAKVESDDDSEESLSPSDVLARRFSDAPGNNGFALMERYERGMRNQLLRLLRQFDQLKKQRVTTPYDEEEVAEMKRAKYEQQLRDDEERYEQTRQRNARLDAERGGAPGVRSVERAPGEMAAGAASPAVQSDSAGPRGSVVEVEAGTVIELSHAVETEHAVEAGRGVETGHAVETARPGAGALDRREDDASDDATTERSQSKPIENVDSDQPAGKCVMSDNAPVTERSQREGFGVGVFLGSIEATGDPSPQRVASPRSFSIIPPITRGTNR